MTELLTLAEAARALRHSTSWLRRAVRSRRIAAYRPLGGQLRFRAEDVEAAIEASRIGPARKRAGRPASVALEDLKAIARTAQ